jgi:hypothetical protein
MSKVNTHPRGVHSQHPRHGGGEGSGEGGVLGRRWVVQAGGGGEVNGDGGEDHARGAAAAAHAARVHGRRGAARA